MILTAVSGPPGVTPPDGPGTHFSRKRVPMHNRIDLANGAINGHDRLLVELIQPTDIPAFIAVNWPAATTICTPANYPAVAAAITRIIAESATALARWKAYGR